MGQILLFAISAFCLIQAANALICAHCIDPFPGIRCPLKNCTAAEDGVCVAIMVYTNNRFSEKMLSCALKSNVRCGPYEVPKKGLRYEIRCCNFDLCNTFY